MPGDKGGAGSDVFGESRVTQKPPTEPRIGMMANEVLKLRGRSRGDAAASPQWIVPNKSIVWHYADLSVVFEKDDNGTYRVNRIVRRGEVG